MGAEAKGSLPHEPAVVVSRLSEAEAEAEPDMKPKPKSELLLLLLLLEAWAGVDEKPPKKSSVAGVATALEKTVAPNKSTSGAATATVVVFF